MVWIGVVASIGAFVAFIDWMLHLPIPEEYDDTEFPDTEDDEEWTEYK